MGPLELARKGALLAAALALSCGSSTARAPASAAEARALHTPPPAESSAEPEPSSSELPVEADDGVWGTPSAPVTLVVFTDLQCPFCARAHASLIELERRYGQAKLRVVIKHIPLAGHQGAVPAARVAQAVLALAGRKAFFQYLDRAFANQDRVAAGEALAIAAELGLDRGRLAELAASAETGRQVWHDVMLADRLAVAATPHFRINGLALTGVRSLTELTRVIDAELASAAELRAAGVAATQIYAARVQQNLSLRESQSSSLGEQ